jgi:hypothetical protein
MRGWSVLPCLRPFDARFPMTAGHNALRETRRSMVRGKLDNQEPSFWCAPGRPPKSPAADCLN